MTDKFTPMSDELHRYAVEHSTRDEVLEELGAETAALGDVSVMQMAPEQAALTTLLVSSVGARTALEVGTFTGYGSIAIARGLAPGGRLVTCDRSEEWTQIAARHFERAGLSASIEVRIGPALETLRSLRGEGSYDFAFIDADKSEYPDYYEECLRLLRPGGMLMVDNVFRDGTVIDPEVDDERVRGIRTLNDLIPSDPRISQAAMLGVADGITLALKR
ncbi:MAG: O-methyltransferase [Solirubrobacterales bacterium]